MPVATRSCCSCFHLQPISGSRKSPCRPVPPPVRPQLGSKRWDGLGWTYVGMSALSGLLLAAFRHVGPLRPAAGCYIPYQCSFFGGGGDCILAFAIGISLGAKAGLAIILISCLLVTAFCLISKKRTSCPLAPFLLSGTIVYLILGEIL